MKRRLETIADAHMVRLEAAELRQKTGHVFRDFSNRASAAADDRAVDRFLSLPEAPIAGAGGELCPVGEAADEHPGMVDTVRNPDAATMSASMERILLADDAGCYDLAFDTAETIQAQNSVEKMLAHQMAACHARAMRMLAKADEQREVVEQVRLVNAASRLMSTFQDAAVTLTKLRSGGQQRVTVVHQHVQVDGGQVAVAGQVVRRGNDAA